VFVESHPRRSPRSENVQTCQHSNVQTSFTPNSPSSHLPYTLPSSVSRKSFTCRSYENTGGVGVFFPFWDTPTCRRFDVQTFSLSPAFSNSCALFCAQQKLNSFLFKRFCTLSQKPPGGGGGPCALAWRGGLATEEARRGNLKVSQDGAKCRLLRQLGKARGRNYIGGVVTGWIQKGKG
jgi:hypothetical protein